jgi:DNA polymerase (family 10)
LIPLGSLCIFFLVAKSGKTDIPIAEAEKVAKDFIEATGDFYDRVEIGGSIRRKVPIVHDIDLCAITHEPLSKYGEAVRRAGGEIVRFSGEYATIEFRGVQINVLFVTPETWGAGLMWSTGPKGHTIGMNIKAEQMGYKFNRSGIYRRSDNTLIPTPTEEDIARLLNWDYKPPERRGLGEKEKKAQEWF